MKVILDTSILVKNYFFSSNKFEALFQYLKKANSDLLILDFVLEELKKNYKQDVESYFKQKEKNERILLNKDFEGNVDEELKKYIEFLTELQRREKINFPKSVEISSKNVFERALKNRPPFQQTGNGFKDTLIWLSIIDTVKKSPDEYFAFISANTKDFGSGTLLEELTEDLGSDSERLLYFNSLEEFLSEYGKKIDFITESFLQNYLLDQPDTYYIDIIDIERLEEYSGIPSSYEIDSIESIDVNSVEVNNYFIYGANSDYYKVQVEIIVSLLLDVRIYDHIEQRTGFGSTTIESSYLADIALLINKSNQNILMDNSVPPEILYLS